jgi:molybdopterin converting factor subunit 1
MTIRVLFFAYLRERVGIREVAIEMPVAASVGDLWAMLRARYDRLPPEPPRFAVNQVYVDKGHTLHDNDELALIPPVSGGI